MRWYVSLCGSAGGGRRRFLDAVIKAAVIERLRLFQNAHGRLVRRRRLGRDHGRLAILELPDHAGHARRCADEQAQDKAEGLLHEFLPP